VSEPKIQGHYLNDLWGVRVRQARYGRKGEWYGRLTDFPGALFDPNGYVRFETEEDYRNCPYLQIRKEVNVPNGISSIPGYVKVNPTQRAIADAAIAGSGATFDPKEMEDARKRIVLSVVQRQGQPEFRSKLLKIYEGKCCITGTDAIQALEAAHICPYRGLRTNHPSNGLLLRADLHTLFDQGLFGIDTDTMTVLVAPALTGTTYATLAGVAMRLPKRAGGAPSKEALNWHRHEYGL
jgi:hypothetical protein